MTSYPALPNPPPADFNMYPGISMKVRKELRVAHDMCSERGLYYAARWAAELLLSMADEHTRLKSANRAVGELPPPSDPDLSLMEVDRDKSPAPDEPSAVTEDADPIQIKNRAHSHTSPSPPSSISVQEDEENSAELDAQELTGKFLMKDLKEFEDETRKRDTSIHILTVPDGFGEDHSLQIVDAKPNDLEPDDVEKLLEEQDYDFYLLGKAYFDEKEFENTKLILRDCHSAKCTFLRCYAALLAVERISKIKHGPLFSSSDTTATFHPEMMDILHDIDNKLSDMSLRGQRLCPFLLYLKGVVHWRSQRRSEAIQFLLESVNLYTYNWSAWEKLCELFSSAQECHEYQRKVPHPKLYEPFTVFYQVQSTMEIHSASELLRPFLVALVKLFPKSKTLEAMSALTAYHLREFDIAAAIYEEVFKADPYRLDDVDLYSNILYMMERKGKLAQLARTYSEIDMSRPETCCLVGNYFSATGDHQAAKDMFMNALKMDFNYLSAWTLLGHEFVEQKNKAACVEGYRRALCVNLKDYRAWFGLGQEYMSDLFYHAMWYFSRATAARPYDVRMWQNLGEVYSKLGRYNEAIRCYKRALISCEPGELGMPIRIAHLYERLSKHNEALKFHKLVVQIVEYGICPNADSQEELIARSRICIVKECIKQAAGRDDPILKEKAKKDLAKILRACTDKSVRQEALNLAKDLWVSHSGNTTTAFPPSSAAPTLAAQVSTNAFS